MKKQLLLLIMMLLPMVASAYDFSVTDTEGKTFYFNKLSDNVAIVKGDILYAGDITIPENVEYEGVSYSVVKIEEKAFMGCPDLMSVVMPKSIIFIGNQAFESDWQMTSISFSENITSIGESAFENCRNINKIQLPSKLSSIQDKTFKGCTGLEEITIPKSVRTIGSYYGSGNGYSPFDGCGNLKKIIIEDIEAWLKINFSNHNCNPLSFAHNLYLGDHLLDEIVIPNSFTEIKKYALQGCESVNKIELPNTIIKIGDSAFSSCSNLISINLPNSITYIGRDSFSGCSKLASIIIPNSLTSIEYYTFSDCESLTSITIPNSITTIGQGAFSGCTGLTSIEIPNSITKIDRDVFYGCSGLLSISIPNSVTTIDRYAFLGCTSLSTLILPNSLNRIERGAFYQCTGLTSLVIPDNVTSLDHNAFAYCTGLTSLTIGSGITSLSSEQFQACTALSQVICMAATPPNVYSGFYQVNINTIKLYVPKESLELYKTTSPWSDFGSINKIGVYNLIYILDGEVYKKYEIEEGDVITPEAAPTREGYTFSGWSEIPETMPAHDVTVTGAFSINKYKLSYTVDDEEYKSYDVEYGASITPEAEPTKEGYTFSGWSLIPETMPAKDVTITGTFTFDDVSEDAEDFEGEGTETSPFIIKSADNLKTLANRVNSGNPYTNTYFELCDNIDMTGEAFEPIGNQNNPFSGIFDGKRYVIKGITVNADSYLGLFGYVEKASINDVGVEDASITGGNKIGGIVGYSNNSVITNCYSSGFINGNDCVGALVGYSGDGTVIQNCFSSMQHTKYQIYGSVGGLVGYNCGKLENSYFYGTINAKIFEKSTTGGIVGYNHTTGSIHCCYFIKYGDIMNGEFNYCGSLNWGDCYGTDSFDLFGITTSGNNLHTKLNTWVDDHSNEGRYRKWTSESFPSFGEYAEPIEKDNVINGHEYVDLGLPSGRLWAKANYGASSEGDYGIYMDWPSRNNIQSVWGSEWTTPTQSDMLELYQECTFTWEYNANSIYGCKVTGPNGRSIFLPAAGFKILGTPQMVGTDIYYWSDNENGSGFAYALQGSAGSGISVYQTWNIDLAMFPIRPVANNNGSSGEDVETHDYVDLALPSGLLWATTNVGAARPEECGSYFAWGETTPKANYSWETYKYANGSETTLTKYTSPYNYFDSDSNDRLDEGDDAATANWGKLWRTPTLKETQELINYCSWTLTSQNGVNGYKVTGANGNSIFLPAGGVMQYGSAFFVERSCVMTSDIFTSNTSASVLCCKDGAPQYWYGWSRCWGYNVRPVTYQGPSSITISSSNEDMSIIGIYDLQGHKLDQYQKGINIVKFQNGATKKVVVK